MVRPAIQNFVEPPWSAPLDVEALRALIPPSARIVGLFMEPIVRALRERGQHLSEYPDRFQDLQHYPLIWQFDLLIAYCRELFHDLPLRQGLRKIGRQAGTAQMGSPVGRLALGAALGVEQALAAVAKSYSISLVPAHAEVTHTEPGLTVIHVTDVYHFLDSHHVGVFEGTLRQRGVKNARVLIHPHGATDCEFLCRWDVGRGSR